MWFVIYQGKHRSCVYSTWLLRKQEAFLGGDGGFNVHKLSANIREVTTVGQKCVLVNGVSGSPTKPRVERGRVNSYLVLEHPGAISPRNPGSSGKRHVFRRHNLRQ